MQIRALRARMKAFAGRMLCMPDPNDNKKKFYEVNACD